MISFPIGIVFMVVVLAVALGGASLSIFLNVHSLVLVIGGTFATLALSTPTVEIKELYNRVMAIWKGPTSEKDIHSDLTSLIRNRDSQIKSFHPLIVYAQDLWEKGVDSQMHMALLGRRMEELNTSSEKAVAALRNLAKYPPALGMTGTVIGLVSLFSHLTPDNRQGLGPLLALAMTATFYGLIAANAILMPLADRLYIMHLSEMRSNEHVFKVLLLIHQDEAPKVIEDELNAVTAA
jgi:chemotaxis protein MotA